MTKRLLIASLTLNLISLAAFSRIGFQQREELMKWYIRKSQCAKIAMLGDSHTEIPDWNKLLDRRDVWEVARYSFTTEQIFKLEKDVDAHSNPKLCFFLGGTNDALSPKYDSTYTLNNYRQIAAVLRKRNIEPVYHTLPYVLDQTALNNRIDSLNTQMKTFCKSEQIDLIDLNQLLATDNNLNRELQKDGLHLNEKGYEVWADAINDYLERNGLE